MASPAEVVQTAPETLPADFSEWDSGETAATAPATSNGFEAVRDSEPAPEPPSQPAKPRATASPVADRMRYRPSLTPATAYGDADAVFQPLRSTGANSGGLKRTRIESKPTSKFKNKMMLTAFTVGSIVLLPILIAQIYPKFKGRTATVKQSTVVSQPTVNLEQKPSPMTELAAHAQTPALPTPQQVTMPVTQPTTPPTTTNPQAAVTPAVQSDLMNQQLAAPARIPNAAKVMADKDAPPSSDFGAAGVDGLNGGGGNTIGSVFNGQGRPKVKVESPKIVNVSAGVAVGLLVQRTQPTYPPIAKTARVSGTVVLQATISKAGQIQGLHVVSGPDMLRQAALDAVRTWRYKPYMLNNDPVAVETTVNVIFALGS